MRELVLVLPDLFLQQGGGSSALPSAMTLRFEPPRLMRGGWRAMLARGAGREDLAILDEASVIDAALGGAQTTREAWLATPLHLVAGLQTVHFPANGLLTLANEEALELAQQFAQVFGDDGLQLVPAGSVGFVLRGLEVGSAVTLDPARLIGGTLEQSLPSGAGSASLRALGSEIELWLHDLPLNRRRSARGQLPVSTLWLWGGGQPPRDPLRAQARAPGTRWDHLFCEDAWTLALGTLAGVPTSPLSSGWPAMRERDDTCCVVAPLGSGGLESLEQSLLLPLAQDLQAGRLGRLVIAANDRWSAVTAADRFRFWRPRRGVFEVLADGAA